MADSYAELFSHPGRHAPPPHQAIGPGTGKWWVRLTDGGLAVWCRYSESRRTASGVDYLRVWGPRRAPIPEWLPDPRFPYDELPARPPNADRITCALNLRGYDGPEVDEALGVADALDTVVDSWEAGEAVPSHTDVRRLATLTGMLPHWFYQGTLDKFGPGYICTRGHGCRVV